MVENKAEALFLSNHSNYLDDNLHSPIMKEIKNVPFI